MSKEFDQEAVGNGRWTIVWLSGDKANITVRHGRFMVFGGEYSLDSDRRGFTWSDARKTRQTVKRIDGDGTVHWETDNPDFPCIKWVKCEEDNLGHLLSAGQRSNPKWKSKHFNAQLSVLNIGILEDALNEILEMQPRDDLLQNVNSVIVPYYEMINAGIGCPFTSAEEVMMYLAWMVQLKNRWPNDPMDFATPGLGSQCHSVCEVYTYSVLRGDEDMTGLQQVMKESDLKLGGKSLWDIQHHILTTYLPYWMAARLYGQGSAAGKELLVDSAGFGIGLQETQAWKDAHETMLQMLEGQMRCHYLSGTYCDVVEAKMDGTIKDNKPTLSIFAKLLTTNITVTFHHHGNRTLGSAAEHTVEGSQLVWLEDGVEKCKDFDGQPVILEQKGDGNTLDSELKGILRFTLVPADENVGFKFRFGPSGVGGGYSHAELSFDPPGSRKLPSFWERERLMPKLCKLGQGLALKATDNMMLAAVGKEHYDEVKNNPEAFTARNFLYQSPISDDQISQFQKLFDNTLKKKYTRDRKGGKVPDRMVITRGYRNHNSSNWVEYSIKRAKVKREMQTPERAGLLRSIENLKTADVLPDGDSDQYELHNDVNEQFLFHGTNDKAAAGITKGDFLVTLAGSNAGTLYGKGVYLAESVSKSDEYTEENEKGERAILICRATLGCVNYNDEVSPDVDALVNSCVNGNFHCVVGDREKCRGTFREIIVYANSQVYPEYVIWYKRQYDN
jgi:hypothetical protein